MTELLLFPDLHPHKAKRAKPKQKMMISQLWFEFICGDQFTAVSSLPANRQKHAERLPGSDHDRKRIYFVVPTLANTKELKNTIRKKALEFLAKK